MFNILRLLHYTDKKIVKCKKKKKFFKICFYASGLDLSFVPSLIALRLVTPA